MLKWIFKRLDGWKRVIGYVGVQVPWLGGAPMALDALVAFVEKPGVDTGLAAGFQVLLAWGVAHGVIKNLGGK